jgi:starvation-inducible DNA-binding protein
MNDLTGRMRAALAETFMFYVEAHICHWNVEGPTFSQLHSLFGEIYSDAHDAVDGIAERIRTLGEKAPETAAQLTEGSEIDADRSLSGPAEMVEALREDNSLVIACLEAAQEAAEEAQRTGIANFLQDRIDKHAKWDWMLTATLKAHSKNTTLRRAVLYDRVA